MFPSLVHNGCIYIYQYIYKMCDDIYEYNKPHILSVVHNRKTKPGMHRCSFKWCASVVVKDKAGDEKRGFRKKRIYGYVVIQISSCVGGHSPKVQNCRQRIERKMEMVITVIGKWWLSENQLSNRNFIRQEQSIVSIFIILMAFSKKKRLQYSSHLKFTSSSLLLQFSRISDYYPISSELRKFSRQILINIILRSLLHYLGVASSRWAVYLQLYRSRQARLKYLMENDRNK